MEPITGASTWALGSQRWTEYIGNFTRNPIMRKIKNKDEKGLLLSPGVAPIQNKLSTAHHFITLTAKSRGREATTV